MSKEELVAKYEHLPSLQQVLEPIGIVKADKRYS